METPIFSLSSVIGSEVRSAVGVDVAVLEDIVCNKDNGKITYFILSPLGKEEDDDMPLFAVHHSFFYFDSVADTLVFSAKIGKDDHSFFLDLPPHYNDSEVEDVASFNRYLASHSSVAGHRSDND
ncbi:PRC-barrel domain-containing protein [Lewinella sp. JB7]|uniref:PRC-barrel domain-containing protein n=1 Tax=Lewinella sp. JB7 TaxID=2962887 RepID=UPI0020C9E363|nr:PRC-barrel domain-containing protein [Lewinella sp. JB7]MCP9234536.1 PRC-barrel domain-containing protein [Lewinella sp. JB7]